MQTFNGPYLRAQVELTDERSEHISAQHPDLASESMTRIAETLQAPDEVRRDERFPATRLFSRWFDDVSKGKHVIIVVVSDVQPEERHWIVTAYIVRQLRQGATEWKRN